jgi:hypothetical protein
MNPAKNTICLWYNGDAEEAARFYARTFPDSSVGAVHRAPGDFPSGKKGDVLTVEFTVMGIPCLGLNGGPSVKHNWAFSFQVATADQPETEPRSRRRAAVEVVASPWPPTERRPVCRLRRPLSKCDPYALLLTAARERVGLSVPDAAARVGISDASLWDLESCAGEVWISR